MKLVKEKYRVGTVVVTKYNEIVETLSARKGKRTNEVAKALITVNGIEYDADEQSMDRMNRIVSLANAEYNYRVAAGESASAAYQATYKDQKVTWVGADNKQHTVQIESLVEVLNASMVNMGVIWAKYSL